jgi:hypothetical protein
VGCHPTLLLGRRKPNPDQLGPGRVDAVHDLGVLLIGQRSKGRRVVSGNSKPGKPLSQAATEPLRHTRRTAIQERGPPSRGRQLADREHELGSIYTCDSSRTGKPSRPHHRYSVGECQPRFVVDAKQVGIALALHHPVHPRGADVAPLATRDPAAHLRHRALHRHDAYSDPKDVNPRDRVARHAPCAGVSHPPSHPLATRYLLAYRLRRECQNTPTDAAPPANRGPVRRMASDAATD